MTVYAYINSGRIHVRGGRGGGLKPLSLYRKV